LKEELRDNRNNENEIAKATVAYEESSFAVFYRREAGFANSKK
jgi:hypothetical protein